MVSIINIIVTSAMLVLGNDVSNPVPYCTVQIQQQEQQPRPEYDLFENPDGGSKSWVLACFKRCKNKNLTPR